VEIIDASLHGLDGSEVPKIIRRVHKRTLHVVQGKKNIPERKTIRRNIQKYIMPKFSVLFNSFFSISFSFFSASKKRILRSVGTVLAKNIQKNIAKGLGRFNAIAAVRYSPMPSTAKIRQRAMKTPMKGLEYLWGGLEAPHRDKTSRRITTR
jgi:hypothetical protein